ncbi:MAG: hypothetical protein IH876_16295 [Gemmatimonadetes bacterium]|nr:hypothetical protein [Gemmatimonadota bacterium]
MLTLLVGYALGTAQILAIAWVRRRVRHRGDLRVLRAELRRVATYNGTFDFGDETALERQTIPRPPSVSPRFADFLTQTDFYLTDENDQSVTQEGLLGILDGCAMFRDTIDMFEQDVAEYRSTNDPARCAQLIEDMRGRGRDYDHRLQTFMPLVQTFLEDIEERLSNASTWRQLNRPLGRLPKAKADDSRKR